MADSSDADSIDLKYYRTSITEKILGILQYTYCTYLDIFLLYLITRFAKDNNSAETKDPILKKRVPNVVFL